VTLLHILAFCAAAILLGLLAGNQQRHWLILALSVVAIYWMQPITPIRQLDFWLPTATILLTLLTWVILQAGREDAKAALHASLPGVALVLALVLALGAMRYLGGLCCITPSPPPPILAVLAGILLGGALAVALFVLPIRAAHKFTLVIVLLTGLLIVLKTPPLAEAASAWLRTLGRQPTENVTAFDIRWLGISYVFFRLASTLLDRRSGRLPALPLHHFVEYVLFFPTYTAGPIDRAERFLKDVNRDFRLTWPTFYAGGRRIVIGMFKKFVLADMLALVALDAVKAAQVDSTPWTWLMLYAYAYRIYFDFSGLSDVAIGLGTLMGFTIPENFNAPYRKSDLTAFWNSWHITLAQWFRAYYFFEVSRALRARFPTRNPALIIAFSQITTMVLIGMWHHITPNYIIWGLWHGVGLFVHNRWAYAMKPHARKLDARPRLKLALRLAGVLVTFHFVLLGWVWFALPTPSLAVTVFQRLFGL
jgi:alginate O-acetyltransferase complex protein AlgI